MSTPAKKPAPAPKTSAERMRNFRDRMRGKGYVQKTIWVPDTSNPEVVEYYRKSALVIAEDVSEKAEIQAFLDAALEEAFKDEPPYDWGSSKP